jgi:hypothetical protein
MASVVRKSLSVSSGVFAGTIRPNVIREQVSYIAHMDCVPASFLSAQQNS